jgi:hypothetical protein
MTPPKGKLIAVAVQMFFAELVEDAIMTVIEQGEE